MILRGYPIIGHRQSSGRLGRSESGAALRRPWVRRCTVYSAAMPASLHCTHRGVRPSWNSALARWNWQSSRNTQTRRCPQRDFRQIIYV